MVPAAVEQFYQQIWNEGELAAADRLLTDDFAFRGSLEVECQGRAEFLAYVEQVRGALADYRCDIVVAVTEADLCFARVKCAGRHVGTLRGVTATGRWVQWDIAALFSLASGQLRSAWVLGDLTSLDQQLRALCPRVENRPISAAEAQQVAQWSYQPPFDVYDSGPAEVFLHPDYRPVLAGDELIGFLCVGAEARVAGQQAVDGVVDIGAGIRPDWLGQGFATAMMPTVIAMFPGRRLRAAVAAFNQRSLRLCRSAGFEEVRRFSGPRGREFVELIREPLLSDP